MLVGLTRDLIAPMNFWVELEFAGGQPTEGSHRRHNAGRRGVPAAMDVDSAAFPARL